jgi:hypothetical protein
MEHAEWRENSGIVAQIEEVAPDAKFVHCSIQEALAARKMLAILKTVLTEAVKRADFTKSRATHSRLFWTLCNEMGSQHDKLLHNKVKWLSQGNVLSCVFELPSEVQIFLSDTTSDLSNRFSIEMWLSRLAYLADILCHLGEFSNSLQGFRTTPFSVHDKTKASRKKNWFHYQRSRKWASVFLSISGQFHQ